MGASAPSLDTPLVLVGHEGRKRVVLAADQAARRAGLAMGMPATKAQALVVGLVILDADPEADGDALQKLAVWMQRHYSPLVTVHHPDGMIGRPASAARSASRALRPCSRPVAITLAAAA